MKTNIKWILIFAAVIAACLTVWFVRGEKQPDGGVIARIEQNGELIREIDLSEVTEPYEFTIEAESGKNTVRVEAGRIAVVEADCPDKVCVKTGYIENGTVPIVCLPHRLAITVTGGGEYDAVAGET